MEKDLSELKPDGFAVNEQYKVIYGRVNGINVMLEPYKTINTHYLTFRMDLKNESKREELLSYLRTLEREFPYIAYAGWNQKFMIYVSFQVSEDEDLEHINTLIERVTEKCNELGLYNCCENCQGHGDFRFVDISGDKYQMCSSCAERIKGKLQDVNEQRENIVLGILGGIIGAIIGSLLWILLDQINFIAGIAGVAIVYSAFKGYERLGRRISKTGVIICVIISALIIIGADLFSLSIDMYQSFSEYYSISFRDAVSYIPYVLANGEILRRFLFNLGIGYLVAVLGSYSLVHNLWMSLNKTEKKEIHYIS